MINQFCANDRVKIKSKCNTENKTGEVIRYISYPEGYRRRYVQVRLDDTGEMHNYNEESLMLIKKGGTNMAAVTGNYRVAVVKFVDGTNTYTNYSFALFDNSIAVDDLVLCDTAKGYNVAKVVDIVEQENYSGTTVTKEIICKVDFSNFEKRKETRKKKETIKKQMDKLVKQNQELVLYQMLAKDNPEMQAMLEEYQKLDSNI